MTGNSEQTSLTLREAVRDAKTEGGLAAVVVTEDGWVPVRQDETEELADGLLDIAKRRESNGE